MKFLAWVSLPADPIEPLHAATKRYVDDHAGGEAQPHRLVILVGSPPEPLTNDDGYWLYGAFPGPLHAGD